MIRVLGRRVLVKREPETEKHGSIIIPAKYRQRPQEGVVAQVGDEVEAVERGDRVLFGRYAGIITDIDGEAYTLLWEADIMGVLE